MSETKASKWAVGTDGVWITAVIRTYILRKTWVEIKIMDFRKKFTACKKVQKEQRKIVQEKDRKKKVLDMCIMTGRA